MSHPSQWPASVPPAWLTHPATISIFLALSTLILYWPVAAYGFITLDDPVYVSENPRVLSGVTIESMHWAFTTTEGGSWHPLTWMSLLVDGQVFGAWAGGYHVVNVLLHVLSTLLLFGLLRRMTGGKWRSAFVAGLFALHPLHVESVAWISERKDVLSTVFWLLTLWAYTRYAVKRDSVRTQRSLVASGAGGWYAATLVLFALGLMSKPMLVTLPFVMLLLDYWPLQRLTRFQSLGTAAAEHRQLDKPSPQVSTVIVPDAIDLPMLRRVFWEKTPFFVLSAVGSVVTIWAQQKSAAVVSLQSMSMIWRIENALVAYARYLGKAFWPADLAVFYPNEQALDGLRVFGAGALLLGLSLAALRFARSQPFLATGWFGFIGTLVPVIGLVQVGAQSMADRYTYVPLIGIFIALAWGATALLTKTQSDTWRLRLLAIAGGLVLIACAAGTSAQLRHWQNSETLFRHTLAVTKDNAVAHGNLGSFLVAQGRLEEAIEQCRLALQINPESSEALNNLGLALAGLGRFDEAIDCYQAVLRLDPRNANALNSLGLALANQGRLADAVAQFHLSLQARPESPDVLNNLGLALALQGRTDEAIEHYHRALELKPNLDRALNNLGLALASQQQLDEAVESYRRALQVNPDYTDALVNLGVALTSQGRFEGAIQSYRQALLLKPDNVQALNNLGMVLTHQGQSEEATQRFRRALELLPDHPQVLNNLGMALAGQGRIEEAISCFERALGSKPDYAEAHARLGRVLAKHGQREDAIHHLEEALQLQPGNLAVREELRTLGVPTPR